MLEWNILIWVLLAYLLGSIPTAIWVGRWFYSIDIRDHGSGNAGATNTFRVLGKTAGIPVLLFDVFKGFIAASIPLQITDAQPTSDQIVNLQLIFGLAALLGHIFPIYERFKGGKGIATLLGIMIAVQPAAAAWCLLIFIMVLFSTKYVSLASLISSICFPLIVILAYQTEVFSLIVFSVFIALMVIFTHRKNIGRLIRGEENQVNLGFGKAHNSEKAQSESVDKANNNN